jgi:hypothetical protein
MVNPQYRQNGMGPKGTGSSGTGMGRDTVASRQDAEQMRAMGMTQPTQTNGAGISPSPTIANQSEDGVAAMQSTSVGSGSRPGPSKFKIGTSAPVDAHGLSRRPPGSLE